MTASHIVFVSLAALAVCRIVVNVRNYFAVFGGPLAGILFGVAIGFGLGFLYAIWMMVSSVIPGRDAQQMANSIVLFVLCIADGLFSTARDRLLQHLLPELIAS